MLLQFLRHADAEDFADSDFARNLTSKGQAQAKRVGGFIKKQGLKPDLILTSPLVRARQTADIVGKEIGLTPSILECLACGMDLDTLLDELHPHAQSKSILVVGHEPDFSDAISNLLGMQDSFLMNVRKASLTGIELLDGDDPQGVMHFSIPARLM